MLRTAGFTTDFALDELAALALLPDVDADALYSGPRNWVDEAWVRVGTGPHEWWLTCPTCDRLFILWSVKRQAVYYRHGGRMIRTPLLGSLDYQAATELEQWVRASCGGPTLLLPEHMERGLVLAHA